MAIELKSEQEIKDMAEGGRKLGKIRDRLAALVKPDLNVEELEQNARDLIKKARGVPNFCLTKDYPYSICCSVNDEIVHGFPANKIIRAGDIVSIDVGMLYNSWHLDTATTVGVGKISTDDQKLLDVTKSSLDLAIKKIKPMIKLGVIQHFIQTYVEQNGFCVIRNLTGHGIGRKLHEDPKIPNFGNPNEGPFLQEGMTLAIEPMVSSGDCKTIIGIDGWSVKMANNAHAAHYEHTIAVTAKSAKILT